MNHNSSWGAVERVALNLEAKGYVVERSPSVADVPFDLGRYEPDLIATRGDERAIVEVKSRLSTVAMEVFREVNQAVRKHGWHFIMVTVPVDEAELYLSPKEGDFTVVRTLLERVEPVIQGDGYVLALPYLWSAYMACLRERALRANLPPDSTSDVAVLDYLYSFGELAHEEYARARELLSLRDGLVHGQIPDHVTLDDILKVRGMVEDYLAALD